MKDWLLRYRGVWLPLILAGALIALAWLQYAWLRDLSEGQRERMKQNASVGAEHFAEEYTRLLTEIQTHFQFAVGVDSTANTTSEIVRAAWDEWESTSEYPKLIQAIYWAGSPNDYQNSGQMVRYARSATDDTIAVSTIPKIKNYLDSHGSEPLGLVTDRSMAYEDPPLLALSMLRSDPGTVVLRQNPAASSGVSIRSSVTPVTNIRIIDTVRFGRAFTTTPTYGLVFVELNENVLKSEVIPRLVSKHLTADGMDFRVAIAKKDATTKWFYSDEGDDGILEKPDIAVPMNFPKAGFVVINTEFRVDTLTVRPENDASFQFQFGTNETRLPLNPENIRDIWVQNFDSRRSDTVRAALRATETSPRGFSSTMTYTANGGWTLYVQHRLGSIDAAAEHFRRRSSVLSLGILSILGIGMLLVVRNNRRANDLARQQMEFVAGVSHELRTPLSVIRSAGDNMVAGLIRDENSAKRYGKLIHSESLRLSDLVEQVLEFSGIQAGQRRYEYRKIDLVGHCIDSIGSLGSRIDPEAVSVHLHLMRPVAQIMADPGALTSVIQNLVTNAIKYSDHPARITITIDQKDHQGGPTVFLGVRDEGHGIPKEDLPRIFDPFYRARGVRDQQIKGNGLGLSIVSSILKQHDATVSVVSEVGKGTEFTIAFRWLHQNEKPS